MHAFDLWAPYIVEPGVIEFDVTPSEIEAKLGRVSMQWLTKALGDLHVEGIPVSWNSLPVRTNFYSDYAEESDWRGRWWKAWIIRVEFAGDVSVPDSEPWTDYPTNALDETVPSPGYDDPAHNYAALVAAVFTEDPCERGLENEIERLVRQQSEQNPDLSFSIHRGSDAWQFRALLTGIEFPACVPLLDSLRDYLKAQGGAITWKHVPDLARWNTGAAYQSQRLIGQQEIPSEEEIKRLLQSEYPGILRPLSGGEKLAHEYPDLPPDKRAQLAHRIARLILDEDATVRRSAIQFFQTQPAAPDEGMLSRALASHSPLLAGVPSPGSTKRDLLFEVARALAEKTMAGDTAAREALRSEALLTGHAYAVVLPLFMADREWLFDNAATIIAGTPGAAPDLFGYIVRGSADLRPVLAALQGRVSRDLIENALEDADAPTKEELLKVFDQGTPDAR